MNKILVNCKYCNINFFKCINEIKRTKNHFCSNKCCREYNNNLRKNLYTIQRRLKYENNPKKCLNCQLIINFKYRNRYKYCSKRCSALHTQRNGGHCNWTTDNKNKLSKLAKNNPKFCGWNKKEKIKKECAYCKINFEVIPSLKNKNCCSRKCKNEWIKKTGYLKNKGLGGFRNNSGTSKKGWYKGYFCSSSWELAWVIFNIEHDIKFDRNFEGFNYIYEGKIRKYYPDFKIKDEYIEIKGYHSKQFNAKESQFPHKLKVLHKFELKEILNYVISKYGKNFTDLYEK